MKNRRKIGCMLLCCISAAILSGCQASVTEQNQITTEESEYESENEAQAYETESANSIGEQEKESVNLRYIPELGYRDTMTGCIDSFNDYVCWRDILVIGNDIYKKENGSYTKSDTVSNRLGLENDYEYGIRQYNNLLITPTEDNNGFIIFDMDTEERKEYFCGEDGSYIVWWYIWGDKIYFDKSYGEKTQYWQESICTFDLLEEKENVVYLRDDLGENRGLFKFSLREDGAMMVEITNLSEMEGYTYISNREYWLVTYDAGQAVEQKIWETDEFEFEHWLDFNSQGLFIQGEYYYAHSVSDTGLFTLTEEGEAVKCEYKTQGGLYFTDDGYYTEGSIEHEKEFEEALQEAAWDRKKAGNYVDSVSKYDYEGNKIGTYRLIDETLLEEGWYLSMLLCNQNEVTAFYANDNTDELYISQIQAESSAADKEWQKCDLPQEEWPDYYFFKNAQQGHYNLSLENEVAFAVKDYARDAGLENEQWELKQIFHWSDDIYQAYTESDMGSELYIILKADTPEALPYYMIAADIRKGDAAAAILYEEYSYNSMLEWYSYKDWFDGKKTADEKQLSLNAIDELYDSIYSNEAYWAICDYLDRIDGNESDQWEINSNSTYIGRNGYIACVSCSNGVKDVLFFVDVWNKTYAIWE